MALLSGGARGIGAAAALALAASGRDVAVADIREAEAQEVAARVRDLGRRSLAVTLDVTDENSVAAAVQAVEERLGAVDVLVNCAGWDEFLPFLETEEQFWRKVIAINFEGACAPRARCSGGWSSAAGDGSSTSAPTPLAWAPARRPCTRAPRRA